MGICQSADDPLEAGGGKSGDEPCPTVFELEAMIEKKRESAERLRDNFVHIEFRRGLFEMYRKGRLDEDFVCSDDEHNDSIGGDLGMGDGMSDESALLGRANPRDPAEKAFVATHKGTGRAYAIREVAVPASRSAREVEDLWKCFDAQALLDHPNICRLQEIFCSEGRYYVVTDLCSGGDLMTRLAAQGRSSYEEREAADLVRKIAGALSHCHSEGVVHGNLRIESCLFEDTGRWADIVIIDAGLQQASRSSSHVSRLSGSFGSAGSHRSIRLNSSDLSRSTSESKKGMKTGWYLPPEVRRGGVCTESGDMWMLGALAWLILAGPLPQPGVSQESARAAIMMGKPLFKGRVWANRSREAVDFVSRMLQKDSDRRMAPAEALTHPWLRPNGDPCAIVGYGDAPTCASASAFAPASSWADGRGRLSPSICASLHAFKDGCIIRRLGLRLVGRTLGAAKMLPAKEAFRSLDPFGKGFITEDDLVKGMGASGYPPSACYSGAWSTTSENENVATAAAAVAAAESLGVAEVDLAGMTAVHAQSRKAACEVFQAMDMEGFGRVGFSTFLAACLAGRPAAEAGARVAFSWLDRKQKGAIDCGDMKHFTGEVLSGEELNTAFIDAHDELSEMAVADAGPIDAAIREQEARKSAASGAVGGLTYAEFYRLLASTPSPSNRRSKTIGGGFRDVGGGSIESSSEADSGGGEHDYHRASSSGVSVGAGPQARLGRGSDGRDGYGAAGGGKDKEGQSASSSDTSKLTSVILPAMTVVQDAAAAAATSTVVATAALEPAPSLSG